MPSSEEEYAYGAFTWMMLRSPICASVWLICSESPRPMETMMTMEQVATRTPREVRTVRARLRLRFCRHMPAMSEARTG